MMRVATRTTLFLLAIAACDTSFSGALDQASSCPIDPLPMPDLAQPQAKCAAAKGLPGDNLLCVDFSQTTIEELKGKGWDFTSYCPPGWEVVAGKLQVKDFPTFSKTCQILLPALNASDYSKYSSFTFSILHKVDINVAAPYKQIAALYLSKVKPDQLLMSFIGALPAPRQRNTIEMMKSVLPNGDMGTYQPLFYIDSSSPSGTSGWQIESIAIQGGP